MTKTHKIYMPLNWKRTKKLTFTFILINAVLLFLTVNNRGITLDNVNIESHLKGFFAKHELRSSIHSSAWLPKLSFLVVQLDTISNRRPNEIQWRSTSKGLSGLILNKYWMHYKTESKQILIPYVILPGKSFQVSLNYEEIAYSSLELPKLFLEEGQQKHLQNYRIKMDSRYDKINISPSIHQNTSFPEKQLLKEFEISISTEQPTPKISWEYKETLKTIEFMG